MNKKDWSDFAVGGFVVSFVFFFGALFGHSFSSGDLVVRFAFFCVCLFTFFLIIVVRFIPNDEKPKVIRYW